ncbi:MULTISPECIES: hypothetical protein [Pseudoalteromonas]|uniref:hypothetical protein n=1 Tax=Pseudoalteromonas TaxID=53246 RepID=UPI000F782653|nr:MULTISPECIES: hypothetical protein [Pseudoalteromonas]MCG7564599.1 hypothetical protein [Pseudoalteromonas sp. McH1-42]MEC4090997.1 hypothetical protein [Pseudoalteromonas rubra]
MNIDLSIIEWAFEKGYNLGSADMREGVYISEEGRRSLLMADIKAFVESHQVIATEQEGLAASLN